MTSEQRKDVYLEATHTTGLFRKLYHVSTKNLNGQVLHPKIPHNYLTEQDLEESKTARICFSPNIDRCLMALSENLKGKELYVHIPLDKTKYEDVKNTQVPDSDLTKEKWVTCDVEMKCIGKIIVTESKKKEYHYKTKDGKNHPLYKWNWKWIEKFRK